MRRAFARFALLLAWALLPGLADAAPFPTRQGEVGLLDVPTAETAGRGGGLLGGEMRLDRMQGQATTFGPMPLSLVFGLADRLDGGFVMREGGQAKDPIPSPLTFGAAMKLRVVGASGLWPAIATSLTLDSFNTGRGLLGARLVASTAEVGRLRFAAYAGAEGHGPKPLTVGPTGGLAVSVLHRSDLETVLEATAAPRGALVGAAFRWAVTPKAGVSIGASWLPGDRGFRVSLGFGLLAAPSRSTTRLRAEPAAAEARPGPAAKKEPTGPTFLDDRPHFRLRLASAATSGAEPRHLQYGPYSDTARLSPTARPAQIKASDSGQILGQELAAAAEALEGRERRLRSAEAALSARQERVVGDRGQLDRQERELAARAQALEARERQLRVPGKPSARELLLAETEEKLRASEGTAAAAERGLREDAGRAAARERDLGGRESSLGAQAAEAAVGGTAASLDARGRAVNARKEWLAAYEARLTAARDRLDATEKSLESHSARLDLIDRRLAAKEERVTLLERRAMSRGIAPVAAPAKAASVALVVKAPAAIVKSAAGAPSGAVASVGKAISAAAVVQLPTPERPLADRDRDAIESTARLAAREGSELLVWARAQNPALMDAAAKRADEVKGVATSAGFPAGRVSTRVTLRPSTTGIDVVVSATRPQGAAEPAAGTLGEGETGKRQLRDAVQAVRGDIERCVQHELARKALDRLEFPLKLSVDPAGRVTAVSAGGALGGGGVDACLQGAAGGWSFPSSDAAYSTEIPVSVVGTGGGR